MIYRTTGFLMPICRRVCIGPGLPGETPCPDSSVFETASPTHIRCTKCAAIRQKAVVLASGQRRDRREKAARAKRKAAKAV